MRRQICQLRNETLQFGTADLIAARVRILRCPIRDLLELNFMQTSDFDDNV